MLDFPYHLRVMSCIVLSQILAIGVFKFWPEKNLDDDIYQAIVYQDAVAVEEVVITRQESTPPAPPKPQIPIPVPNDQVIDEQVEIPEELDVLALDMSPFGEGIGGEGDSNEVIKSPQLPPNVIKIVEPTLPKEAKESKLKAEVVVSFLVGKEGEVQDAFISEIRIYDKKGVNYEVSDYLGYGLLEATIEAALFWKFRPAKDNGAAVRTMVEQSFFYGDW